jgi:hypothetical protein
MNTDKRDVIEATVSSQMANQVLIVVVQLRILMLAVQLEVDIQPHLPKCLIFHLISKAKIANTSGKERKRKPKETYHT